MKKKKLLYFFYNRFNDPLLQSNIFLYIHALSETGLYDAAIITYEDRKFPLSSSEKKEIQNQLKRHGIHWYPLKWHAGSNLFLKCIDLFSGVAKLTYLSVVKRYRHAVSLGSIAGSFLYLFSKIARIKFYLYQYEPHSEYALDNGIWTKESPQYKLLHRLEKKSVVACNVVSSGTDGMRKRLEGWNIKAGFFKVRSVVNENTFHFNADKYNSIRKDLNVSASEKLVIYPGKLGELYCSAQDLLRVFKMMYQHDSSFKFLAVTPGNVELEQLLAKENGTFKLAVTVLPPVSHNQMPNLLSASDFGIIGVLPGPSKQFMSPIKVGEYLCCGLPYLICADLEDSDIAKEKNVGVVVRDFSDEEIKRACGKIKTLMEEPKQELAKRCRDAGIFFRGFERQFEQFKLAVNVLMK